MSLLIKVKHLKKLKLLSEQLKKKEKRIWYAFFFEDEDSIIKYTILENKTEERSKLYEKKDLIKNDKKK